MYYKCELLQCTTSHRFVHRSFCIQAFSANSKGGEEELGDIQQRITNHHILYFKAMVILKWDSPYILFVVHDLHENCTGFPCTYKDVYDTPIHLAQDSTRRSVQTVGT